MAEPHGSPSQSSDTKSESQSPGTPGSSPGSSSPGSSSPGSSRSDAQGESVSTGGSVNLEPGELEPGELEPGELEPAELIARHQRGVWRYLRMLGCDEATADDLTQETFLRVLRRDSFVQHSDAATSSYLRRTAYNLLISLHRKQGRVQTVVEPAVLDEVWDRWAGKDLTGDVAVESLQACLSALTDRARTALRMRFTDQASRADIGKALDITEHGARNLMQRAKQQLRNCVEERVRQNQDE